VRPIPPPEAAGASNILVLDSSAFIVGFNPSVHPSHSYSVPAVAAELLSKSMAFLRFNASIENGRLIVRMPTSMARELVSVECAKLGERTALSEADRQVLALGLELKLEGKEPTILSDDYSIQNVADHLRVQYQSLATFGIAYGFGWTLYCPACFRTFSQGEGRACPVCGTELKRKVLKKMATRRKF